MHVSSSDNTVLPYHFFTFPDIICIESLKRCRNILYYVFKKEEGKERGKINTKSDYVICECSLL